MIPKIVSTPIKWVSKKAIRGWLLRFPSGKTQATVACVFCPEMCRFSCPTAVVSGNDAVTPCNKVGLLYKETRWPGRTAGGGELWTLYDCTGCGRCTEYCVHGQPVADLLFSARAKHGWGAATAVAKRLKDADDRFGDLADELGDAAAATRRLEVAVSERLTCREPKALFFARSREHTLEWEFEREMERSPSAWLSAQHPGKRWLVVESPWLSRRLGRAADVERWHGAANGIEWVFPFQRGRDVIDSGGEGAYRELFADQARAMAQEIWERDRHRADAVFCWSERAARHFREALPAGVPVVYFGEWA